jgi:hypothetical protein
VLPLFKTETLVITELVLHQAVEVVAVETETLLEQMQKVAQVATVLAVGLLFITNMWAIINRETKQVVSMLEPMATQNEIDAMLIDFDLVLMTIDNSPAHLFGYYEEGKFTPPKPNGGEAGALNG